MINRRVGCVIAISMMIVAMLSYPAFWLIQWLPWRTEVRVAGKVVDDATGEPIADARVVVTLIRNGFPYQSFIGYGAVTNDAGEFSIESTSNRAYNSIMIEASSPDDKYAQVPTISNPMPIADVPVILTVSPLPKNHPASGDLRYRNFKGHLGYSQWSRITFVGNGWKRDSDSPTTHESPNVPNGR